MGSGKSQQLKNWKTKKTIFCSKKPLHNPAHKFNAAPVSATMTRTLRSGEKIVPIVIKRKSGFRQNENMLIPELAHRSSEPRKSTSDKHTSMIVQMGTRSRNLDQKRQSACVIDWKKMKKFEDDPSYQLLLNRLARCHILADSRIQVIVPFLVKSLSARFGCEIKRSDLQPPEIEFVSALSGRLAETWLTHLVVAVNATTKGKCNAFQTTVVVQALSLGENNLFFGDADRNSDISNGFDMLFDERGLPDPRAVRIREAVLGLAANRLIDDQMAMNAITPTRDKRTGLAQTSSGLSAYDPQEQLNWGRLADKEQDPGTGYNESPF